MDATEQSRQQAEQPEADTLVIVPSAGNPQQIPRLVSALANTQAQPIDVMLVVPADEQKRYRPLVEEPTRKLFWLNGHLDMLTVDAGATYVRKVNEAAHLHGQRYRYLYIVEESSEVLTADWDLIFKQAIGGRSFAVAWGLHDVVDHSQPFFTSSIVTALGWALYPECFGPSSLSLLADMARTTGNLEFTGVKVNSHRKLDPSACKEPDAEHDSQVMSDYLGSPSWYEHLARLQAAAAASIHPRTGDI